MIKKEEKKEVKPPGFLSLFILIVTVLIGIAFHSFGIGHGGAAIPDKEEKKSN